MILLILSCEAALNCFSVLSFSFFFPSCNKTGSIEFICCCPLMLQYCKQDNRSMEKGTMGLFYPCPHYPQCTVMLPCRADRTTRWSLCRHLAWWVLLPYKMSPAYTRLGHSLHPGLSFFFRRRWMLIEEMNLKSSCQVVVNDSTNSPLLDYNF